MASYDGKVIKLSRIEGLEDTLIHEIQHAIQKKEGFAHGGSPAEFAPKRLGENAVLTPDEQYHNLAGEIEARDTAERAGLNDKFRRSTRPELRDDAIVVFGDETVASYSDKAGGWRSKTPEENAAHGLEAMNKAIAEKTDMLDVMYRPKLGGISFFWVKPGRGPKLKGGEGIAHLIAARNAQGYDGEAAARAMPEVIAHGTIGPEYTGKHGGDPRRNVDYKGRTAVLSLYRYGNKQTWLVTGWGDNKAPDAGGGIYGSDASTHTRPTPLRSDVGAEAIEENIAPLGVDGKPLFQARANDTGSRGRLDVLSDGSFLVNFTQAADASTPIHEAAHMFVELARQVLASSPDEVADWAAFEQVQGDIRKLADWAGQADPYGEWSIQAHEKLARGFETYLMEGKPPTEGLRGLFERMKAWLLDIYREVKNLDAPLMTRCGRLRPGLGAGFTA